MRTLIDQQMGGKASTLAAFLVAALVVAWAVAAAPAGAQSGSGEMMITGKVVVRLHSDGQIEYAFQPRSSERILPKERFFPAAQEATGWHRSTPVVLGGVSIGRIEARRLANLRTEFAFVPRDGDRILPAPWRYFPNRESSRALERVNRWLGSSEITFSVEQPSVAEMEVAILMVLFNGEPAQANYNDWGCPNTFGQPGIECSAAVWSGRELREKKAAEPNSGGYIGGHSGWDAQTLSVVGEKTDNERFYAVSPGVIKRFGSPTVNLIAVWHRQSNTTTIYLHARSLNPALSIDDPVEVGTWLGVQGDRGTPGAEHVHIEVRAGKWTTGAGGADPSLPGSTCNPVDFLWRSIQHLPTAGHACGVTERSNQPNGAGSEPIPATVRDGQQMYRPGTGEVYVAKIIGNQRHKRLFLTGEIRDSYGHLKGKEPKTPSQMEFDSFSTSCIVLFGSNYYFLDVREGADRANKFRISGDRQGLLAAGVVEAAIFEVHGAEINDEAFDSRSSITAAQAVQMHCGN